MKLVQNRNPFKKFAQWSMILCIGVGSASLTGCSANIDDFITGITSNVCVFSGTCNGSTFM
jgi:hypothetical protein